MRAEGSNAISGEASNYLKRAKTRTFPDLLISRSYYLLLMNPLVMPPYHIQSESLVLILVDKEQKKMLLTGKKRGTLLKVIHDICDKMKD